MVILLYYSDVYQEKFKDLFDLNDSITHQLDKLKQKIADKDNDIDKIKKENSEYIEEMFSKNEEINNILKNEIDSLKLELTTSNNDNQRLIKELEDTTNENRELSKVL